MSSAVMSKKPYKLVPYEDGFGAEIVDRATGHQIGYVLRARSGWEAYLLARPGWQLPFFWFNVVEDENETTRRFGEVLGYRWMPALTTHYRADAAERVWRAHTEGR